MNNRLISVIRAQNINLSFLKSSTFFGELLLLSCATILCQGSRFVVNLGAARILGPATFGLWSAVNLILVYSGAIHLGVINAMNRDVPLFKGKGDLQKVEEIRRVSLGFVFISTFATSTAIAIVALFIENLTLRTSLLLIALLLLCTQIYIYLQVYLKSDKRFNQMSYQQLAFAGILPAIVIPLVLMYNLSGFILGQSGAILAISFFIVKSTPFDFRPRFNMQETVRLVRVGFPMMAAGLLYGLLTTVDRWIITSFLGVEQLGYYSLAIMVMGILTLVPTVVAQQIYPRMAETFGRTSSYSDLKKWIFWQTVIGLVVTLPIAIGVYFIMPPVIRRFLPAYVPGIAAIKIILIGVPFLPLAWGFGNFLNTVDKQVYGMVVQGFAVLFNLGINIAFVKMELGINGVALGTALSYVIYSVALFVTGSWVIKYGNTAEMSNV